LNELSETKPISALNRTELADLAKRLAEKGLLLNHDQQEQLWKYAELLLDWNKKVNLISRKDEDAVLTKHVLHALSLALFHSFKPKGACVGFRHGRRLARHSTRDCISDTYFLLIDSIGKKINACSDMIQKLELKNVLAQKSRSDELKNVKFDVIVSRQVAAMPELCAWCRPLLKKGGKLLCLKGGDLEEEIGQALIEGAEKLAFPEHIEQHPIDFLGEKFKEKCVVIAV
jgi:16S rRNA (guanine527-N7)-methyltransferase